MPDKIRATVYVNRDNWVRLKAITEEVGVLSISGIVDNYVEQMVPFLEQALIAARDGDRQQMMGFLDAFVSQNIGKTGSELAALRNKLLEEPEKGESN